MRSFLGKRHHDRLEPQVLPGSGLTFVEPVAINDGGEIVGNGGLPNGDTRAVVLKPNGQNGDMYVKAIAPTTSRGTGLTAKQNSVTALREAPVRSTLDKLRSQMRQRYNLPGQPAAQRD